MQVIYTPDESVILITGTSSIPNKKGHQGAVPSIYICLLHSTLKLLDSWWALFLFVIYLKISSCSLSNCGCVVLIELQFPLTFLSLNHIGKGVPTCIVFAVRCCLSLAVGVQYSQNSSVPSRPSPSPHTNHIDKNFPTCIVFPVRCCLSLAVVVQYS